MPITRNLNCVSFLISSILVVPLIVQLLIISQSGYLINCLSLTELHSTLPSNNNNNNNNNHHHHNRFKSKLLQEKSIRDAIRNLNHIYHQKLTNRESIVDEDNYQPQQQSINNNGYELIVDGLDGGNNFNEQYLTDLPMVIDDNDDDLQANLPNYLIVKSPTINGINKRQDEVVMDIPLEYTSDIPYEFYPELWPSNQQKSSAFHGKVDGDDLSSSDLLSQVLAAKIANLLETESSGHANNNNPQRKRVLVKRNHRSGLSNSNGGNHNRGRFAKVSPHLASRSHLRSTKTMAGDSKRHSSNLDHGKEIKVNKVTSRKLGDTKKVKLNRIPLKSTLIGHQPVKGDFAKLVNGKAVHVLPMRMHPKVINSSALGHKELEKSKKQPLISKNFRKIDGTHRNLLNVDRKETAITNPLAHQSSMKEFFNEIDLPKGPRNIVKRSISPRSAIDIVNDLGLRRDDDTVDGDDDLDGGDDSVDGNGRQGEDDLGSEVSESDYRSAIGQLSSSPPMILQSNPWLVDEATRTLMRSLTVKRRKRGNNNNMKDDDDQLTLIGLDDGDLTTSTSIYTTTTTSTSTGDNNEDEDGNTNIKSNTNDDDRLSEIDEVTSSQDRPLIGDVIDLDDVDEIQPARIVKKDGVTLNESPTGSEDDDDNLNLKVKRKEKKLDNGLITNGSQQQQQQQKSPINRLIDGIDPIEGDNETFFEEEFSEGLISIGDLDDLEKMNKSITVNRLINEVNGDESVKKLNKRVNDNPQQLTFSPSSTLPPLPLTNGIEDRGENKLSVEGVDEQIFNGSGDPDEQLFMETINGGFVSNNKRKRSVTPSAYFGKVGESSSALIAQETAKFNDVDDKLERIEETLILEALDLIKGNLNGETGQLVSPDVNVKQRIESRLNAAYDLEDMRLALTDLHKIMKKMSTEEDEEVDRQGEIDQQVDINNDHGNEINDLSDGREIYLDSTGKVSLVSKLDDDDDDNGDGDEEQDVKGDIGNRNKPIGGHSAILPSKLSSFNNYRDSKLTKNHHLIQVNSEECPAIRALTTDCSAVKDVVPYGSLQKIFRQACNWHEVCYSCGELFGLLSSDCDMGFLEQSRLACNDSASCETASRLILIPLKSRRTFYKQKVPPMCYQQPCVETFLLKSRRKR